MRGLPLVLVATLWVVAADNLPTDQEAIQGTWLVKKATRGAKELPPELVKNLQITFQGDKIILRVKGEVQEAAFALDSTRTPKQISIRHGKGKVSLGIYDLTDNELWLCVAPPGRDRPTAIDKPAADCELLYLKRGES